jgi:hypothetical protein
MLRSRDLLTLEPFCFGTNDQRGRCGSHEPGVAVMWRYYAGVVQQER